MAKNQPVPVPATAAIVPRGDTPLVGVARRGGVAFAFALKATPRRFWHPEHAAVLALWLGTVVLAGRRLLG